MNSAKVIDAGIAAAAGPATVVCRALNGDFLRFHDDYVAPVMADNEKLTVELTRLRADLLVVKGGPKAGRPEAKSVPWRQYQVVLKLGAPRLPISTPSGRGSASAPPQAVFMDLLHLMLAQQDGSAGCCDLRTGLTRRRNAAGSRSAAKRVRDWLRAELDLPAGVDPLPRSKLGDGWNCLVKLSDGIRQ